MSTYEISKSSLLSLKAEILRKQQELSKVQKDNKVKIQNLKKNTPLDLKNKGVEQRESRDISDEEINLLKQSRTALEAKAKLYDKLSKEAAHMTEEERESHWRYLVRFDKKSSNSMPNFSDEEDDKPHSSEDEACTEDYEPAKNPDEEWVEYVDCLGRTRTCLRKDLEHLKLKDAELRSSVDLKERGMQIVPEKKEDEVSEKAGSDNDNNEKDDALSEQNELLSSDMRREILRRQWEKEEEALRDKRDIHYQDILFNEARTHGVGYYGFSKDDEVRAQQQEALKKLREETEQQQKKAQELKALREKQLAARAKAARNRRRARMGLPPEEDEPEEASKEVEKTTAEEKKLEEEKEKEKLKMEREKEKKRSQHIRPWDKGKEGVKEHREYTQHEWVDKKRKERPAEFAPPTSFRRESKSKSDYKDDAPEHYENKSLYFSTKKIDDGRDKPKESINPYKRRNASPEVRTPIVNELSDDDDDHRRGSERISSNNSGSDSDDFGTSRGRGVEVAPPPTFEYYGPGSSKKKRKGQKKGNIEDSISAGLKFLREQAEQKQKSSKRDADMFIM